jgi:hypothetical protein
MMVHRIMTGVGQGHVSDWLVAYPAGTRHGYATDIGQFVTYLDSLGVELTARHPAGRVEITSGPAQPDPTVFWETVFEVTA